MAEGDRAAGETTTARAAAGPDGSRRGVLVACVSLLALTAGAAAVPDLDTIGQVDAVVVLGGGSGGRLDLGLELASERDTVLVLAGDTVSEASDRGIGCGDVLDLGVGQGTEVACVVPDPVTTAGEAAGTTALADATGWQRVAVVTDTFHVDRARTLFAQCLEPARVDVTGARAPTDLGAEAWRRGRELVGRVAAVTVRPAC